MRQVELRTLKLTEVFKRKASAKTVFIKGSYDGTDKRFECFDWDDVNRFIYLSGTAQVWIDFTF